MIKIDKTQEDSVNLTTDISNKLVSAVNSFIINNQEYSFGQKELLKKNFKKALDFALEIHGDQEPRPDGPYVNHILRVANRIVEEYEIKDPEIVIAGLLHDSVEDQTKKIISLSDNMELISEREKALIYIKNTFGKRVAGIVFKLSNPEPGSEKLRSEQKNSIYKEHVKEVIEDPDVFLIKLSDFSDNVLNLEEVSDLIKRLKLSKKYLPVLEVFIKRMDSVKNILNQEKITKIKSRLLLAMEDIDTFIKVQENTK